MLQSYTGHFYDCPVWLQEEKIREIFRKEELEGVIKYFTSFQDSLFQDSEKIIEKVWNEGKCYETISWKYRSAMSLDPEAIHKPRLPSSQNKLSSLSSRLGANETCQVDAANEN